MKTFFYSTLFLVLLIAYQSSLAQSNFIYEYDLGGNDYGNSIVYTNDNGLAVVGTFDSTGNGTDIYLMKMSLSGTVQWVKTYGTTGNELGRSLLQKSDGGFVICATMYNVVNGNTNYAIIDTDANGIINWIKNFSVQNTNIPNRITLLSNGNYLIAGPTYTNGNTATWDPFYVIVDPNGNLVWSAAAIPSSTLGDVVYGMIQIPNGHYIGVGALNGLTSGYIVDYDQNYNYVSANQYSSSDGNVVTLIDLINSSDNSILAIRGKDYGGGNRDAWIYKFTYPNTAVFSNTYGGSGFEEIYGIVQATNGDYCAVGKSNSPGTHGLYDMYIFRTDINGNILWSTLIGTTANDGANDIATLPNNYTAITGYVTSVNGKQNTIVMVTDISGNTTGCGNAMTSSKTAFSPIVTSISPPLSTYNTINNASSYNFTKGLPNVNVNCSTLPINLISFYANSEEHNTILIEWVSTFQDENSYIYTLEKSYDGITFSTISEMTINEKTGSLVRDYYVDQDASKDLYYRLKVTNNSGYFFYSYIITQVANNSNPNNAINISYANAQIIISTQDGTKITGCTLTSINGDPVLQYYSENPESFMQINPSKLSTGIYIATITTLSSIYQKKILISE